ncbi:hypothetical protein CABS01_11744 [Colletotrichum abscissum]|uniref:Uncharacterized protein n=1 Tax=Colletotrichum abscissum TaxID=1671311 RepID=A0A9P9XE86_9PEZI|nr:uncharacterized protein CABS01_11744 [Colletotrichum abscissum]KAI3548674.1 hypothetical protein CABS02_08204 [Colletotrichum abscissum]KAK1492847.1 hypothetical protein CABS01_11744 [Colletotrichum abscissum]
MVRIVMEDFSAWTGKHEYSLLYHSFLHKKPLDSTDVNQLKCPNVNQVTVISRGLDNERKNGPPSGMAENDRVLKPDVVSHQRRLVNTTTMFRRRGLEAERRRSGHAAVLTAAALYCDAGGGAGKKNRNRITNAVTSSIITKYGSEICSFAWLLIRYLCRAGLVDGS